VLATLSAASPVAYVEAEYFGGVGQQRAAVWAHAGVRATDRGLDEDELAPSRRSILEGILGY
jgi:hypothetical protein